MVARMKLIVLAALFACALAMPKRLVLPRLPTSVYLSGHYQMIPEDKIVGGSVVTPNSLPFQISLQRRNAGGYSHSCGGSILDKNVILDAAHCLSGTSAVNLRVVAGEHELDADSGLEQIRNVASFKVNNQYSSNTYENDIALIFLDAPLDLDVPSAKPVNLPSAGSEPTPGTLLTVSGWGTTSSGGSLSNVLKSVNVPVVSDADCDSAYGGTAAKPAVYPSMLCAGDYNNGGIDSCQGDSGGPLFRGTGELAIQEGIVSWGQGCALANYPGVYTQVSYFLDWIAANRE